MDMFDKLGEETAEAVVETTGKKSKKKKPTDEKVKLYVEKLKSSPELKSVLHTLSDSLIVTGSLGFRDEGSIVLAGKKQTEDGVEREIAKTSKIVGYMIKNVSDEAINYTTSQCTLGEDGVWVETQVEKTLAPGEQTDIPKKFMTILTSDPRFSFQLGNGYMKKSSSKNTQGSLDGELESWYFYSSEEGAKVNSDAFKQSIGQEVTDGEGNSKWIVLPEYEATFGVLNNDVAKSTRGTRGSRDKSNTLTVSPRDAYADYIQSLLKEQTM